MFFNEYGQWEAILDKPLDISIPVRPGPDTVNCFYAPYMEVEPVVMGDFIGSVSKGGSVNFVNVRYNPHGNGTHTECVGHISEEFISILNCLKDSLMLARVISVFPGKRANGDRVISPESLEDMALNYGEKALIIRTLPNDDGKLTRHYSGTNPPYFDPSFMDFISEWGVDHLLTDLPSVDREEDGGALSAHKRFWDYPGNPRTDRTITELIYVPDQIVDGSYLLNLQVGNLDLDASPSKPLLYPLSTR